LGDLITVSVGKTDTARSTDGFRGFLVVAREANDLNGDNIGSFQSNSDETAKTLKCKTPASAMTHTNLDLKDNVSFSWSPGETFVGDIVFVGTIVRNFTEYYAGVKSSTIKIT